MAADVPGQSYTISGVKVQFPCKAYPSQLSMMDKIIKGLHRNQNCLLESPTGSGKSLALLCSALAWQQLEHEKISKENEAQKEACCSCKCSAKSPPHSGSCTSRFFTEANQNPPTPSLQTPAQSPTNIPDIEDGDFKPQTKKIRNLGPEQALGGPQTPNVSVRIPRDPGPAPRDPALHLRESVLSADTEQGCTCQCDDPQPPVKKRVPKIYFGTRTHKQIAQIARELGKTAYKHVRMTILASREHTCIDAEVSRSSHKSEECKNKLDGPGCRYFDKVRKISHRSIRNNGLDAAWDLEQFVSVCRSSHACPYFGSRSLKEGADIIFCPYNYLIDPIVRQSLEISLKDQIVILDEAHNIEDSSREAASFSITQAKLKEAMTDLDGMIEADIKTTEHGELHTMMSSFNELINRNIDHLEGTDYDHASKVWTGPDIVAQLKHTGVGPGDIDRLRRCYEAVNGDENETNRRESLDKLRPPTLQSMEGLFMVLGYIYKDKLKFLDDYRVAIVRTQIYTDVNTHNRWLSKRRGGHKQLVMSYNLHFWCLNPAVAFSDIGEVVRTVVLTSGTLSPLGTFQSELSAPFPIQLEANHIITNSQVWVGTISRGPKGVPLLGSYQNSETFAYQDDVGGVILNVCKTIPYGVLVFLPSYKYLEKLSRRWKTTSMWSQLTEHKVIMTEPRSGDKEDFDTLIKEYYATIELYTDQVCRGKVSEGLDFADNNARAVIAVGIPYPSIKDTQVELKKQYNDQRSSTRGLLRGRDWYDIQAYRAINQALGRCIRHRNDWGALVLVDDRYSKNPQKYIKGLSKWVRQRVQYYTSYFMAHNSLQSFTKDRLENPIQVNVSMMGTQNISLATQDMDSSVRDPQPLPSGFRSTEMFTPRASTTRESPNAQCSTPKAPANVNLVQGMSTPNVNTIIIKPITAGHTSTPIQVAPGNTILIRQQHTPTTAPIYITPGQALLIPKQLRMSQAGGFLLSQTQTQQIPNAPIIIQGHVAANLLQSQGAANRTTSNTPNTPAYSALNPMTQSTLTDTQIQAGHGMQTDQHNFDTSQPVLGFNPSMASTQMPDLGFNPPMASTQMPGTPACSRFVQNHLGNITPVPHHRQYQTVLAGSHATGPKATLDFKTPTHGRLPVKSPSPQQVPPSEVIVIDGTPTKHGARPQDCVVSPPAAVVPRSDSPALFDSDGEDNGSAHGVTAGQTPTADTDLDRHRASDVDVKDEKGTGLPWLPVSSRRPLFKKPEVSSAVKVKVIEDGAADLSVTTSSDSANSYRKKARNRLSKSFSKVDQLTQDNRDNCDAESVEIKSEFDLEQKVTIPAEKNNDDDDFKTTISEEILNTKRQSARNKRRRSGSVRSCKRSKGINFDGEEDDHTSEDKVRTLAVICPTCGKSLSKLTDFKRESHKPAFMKAMQRRVIAGELITVASKQLLKDTICCIQTSEPELNCHWSAEDGAIVQFVGCAKCSHDNKGSTLVPCVGAHVVLLRDNHNPRLQEGQVWLLPHCVQTEPST